MTNQVVTEQCSNCGSKNLVTDRVVGESICGDCGLVIEENIIDRGAEWRYFTQDERNSRERAGSPIKYSHHDKGLATLIPVDRDAYGRPLPAKVRREMRRLRRSQFRSYFNEHRNLTTAMNELQRLSEKLHVPSAIREMAAVVYRKTLNKGLVQGRKIEAVVAASLYAACRFTKIPRTLKEIADVSSRDIKEISRDYRVIVENLSMRMPVNDPMDHVTKIAEKVEASSDVEGLAIKIIQEAKKKQLTLGRDPSAIAATALYIASKHRKERITQSRLAKAAETTEITIRTTKNHLLKELDPASLTE